MGGQVPSASDATGHLSSKPNYRDIIARRANKPHFDSLSSYADAKQETENIMARRANKPHYNSMAEYMAAKQEFEARQARNKIETDDEFMARVTASAPGSMKAALAKRGLRDRLTDSSRSFGYTMRRQVISGAKTLPKKLGRTVRRTALGAAGAIPLAILAAGAGAATGDPAKAAAMVAGAAGAGYSFANYYGDKGARAIGAGMNSAQTAFWGTELKARQQYKFDEQFKKSPELRDALMKVYNNKEEVEQAINSGAIQAFLNDGETDVGRIAKAMYLKDKVFKKEKVDPSTLKKGEKNGYGLTERQALERALVTARMTRNLSPNAWINGTRENEVIRRSLENQFASAGVGDKNKITEEIDRILEDQGVMNS